jgi:hypothetical protein
MPTTIEDKLNKELELIKDVCKESGIGQSARHEIAKVHLLLNKLHKEKNSENSFWLKK